MTEGKIVAAWAPESDPRDATIRRALALLKRWNLAASMAGFSGSEYVDEPEAVFARAEQRREFDRRLAARRALIAKVPDDVRSEIEIVRTGLDALALWRAGHDPSNLEQEPEQAAFDRLLAKIAAMDARLP